MPCCALAHIPKYGIAISNTSYCIQYSCPSGLETSAEFRYDNLEPIIKYIYTLYCPRTDQAYNDPTITLSDKLAITDAPKWDIQADGVVFRRCKVKTVGYPWRRMSWVAQTEGDDPLIIKDSYRSAYCSFLEWQLYDLLHENGVAPGFALVLGGFDVLVDGTEIVVAVGNCKRIKTRLIMGTSGDSLSSCASAVTFLKIMYDILEAHRWAVRKRNVLHRDISYANIIINAKNAIPLPVFDERGRPKFVTEVLDRTQERAPPLGTLIDVDNGTPYGLDRTLLSSGSGLTADQMILLRYRTGTPRFIARPVANGRINIQDFNFEAMPVLTDDALRCYQLAYPADEDILRTLSDEGMGTTHFGCYNVQKRLRYKAKPELRQADFVHHPRHDAESVFWVIVVFLLRALPKGADPHKDKNNAAYNKAWQYIANHEIQNESQLDSRNEVLRIDEDEWTNTLHKELVRFAPLLSQLIEQVKPEYELLDPAPDPFHLHEAMQRILFNHIYEFQKEGYDVELETNKSRSTIEHNTSARAATTQQTKNGQDYAKPSGSKRPSEAMSGPIETRQSKRIRPT